MIIWLASYPRSGNTFFRILLNHLYAIKTPTVYIGFDGVAVAVGEELVGHVTEEPSVEEMASSSETFIVKTHKREDAPHPTIYLVRDGRDSLVSYARSRADETNTYEHVLRELITTSASATGTWGQNVCHWLNQDMGNTIYVRYEDLIQHPEEIVEQTLLRLNHPLASQKINQQTPTFADLQTINSTFFRRGIVGSYKDEMPEDLHALFWAQPDHVEAMQRLGYQ
ncbi:MAG: sulfotransferase domain-containing protein [Chloroflexota bacterium]